MDNQRVKDLFWASVISLAFVVGMCLLFHPRWETNDDVAMSMVAHGYGLVATGSPNLIFSNVIWGYFVRHIPPVNGTLGYSIATMGILVIFGVAMVYALRRLGTGWLISIIALSLVLVRPILFPQFTINSGLMTVGAILCWYLYGIREGNKTVLLVGCFLAFVGYLVRSQEFLLVLFTGLPLLQWNRLVKDRSAKIAALFLVIVLGVAEFVDYQAYQGKDWQAFNALNSARLPYTDFGATSLLLSRPDVYEKYSYSENDVRLIGRWGVYADPKLADSKKLNQMLLDIEFAHKRIVLANVAVAFKAMLHPSLLPIFLVALMFLLAKFNLRISLVLGIFLLSITAMALLGRPGIIRVYYPLVAMLFIFSIIIARNELESRKKRWVFLYIVLFVGVLINYNNVIAESRAAIKSDVFVRSQLVSFPDKPVIVWGSDFPYDAVYPVLNIPMISLRYQLHGFGVFSPAPFSVASRENRNGRGMASQLASRDGMSIVADDGQIQVVGRYCNERLRGELKVVAEEKHGAVFVRTIRCEMHH